MFRSLALALAVLTALILAAPVSAAPINAHEQGSFTTTTAGPPNVGNVTSISSSTGGFTFTNNVSTTTFGAGGTIVTVGATPLTSFNQSNGNTVPVTFNGQQVVAVFAIQGTAPSGSGNVTATFTEAKLGFFTIAPNTFNTFNPISWGATNATGTALNTPALVTTFGIKPQELITAGVAGSTQDVPIFPPQVNQSTINAATSGNTQGHFLLQETGGGLAGFGWETVTTGPFPGFTKLLEGLHVRSDQGTATATSDNTAFVGNGSAGLAALNTIAAQLGGGLSNGFFATGLNTGTAAGFNPSTTFPVGPDLLASIGLTFYPILEQDTTTQQVPEPASMALFGALVGVGGLVYRKRRNTKAIAA